MRENAIPFTISREVPNSDAIAAVKEVEEMKKHPELYKSYDDVNKMMEDIIGEI